MLLRNNTFRNLTYRHSLLARRAGGQSVDTDVVMEHLLGFVYKLQRRYPFNFAVAYRDAQSEANKQVQERLTCHYLFGAVSEMAEVEAGIREKIWRLGGILSGQIAMGGENFRPAQFSTEEKKLAVEIGEDVFSELLIKIEELSLRMKFSIGPVNPAEHAICWSFRYVRQLLQAAKWESKHPGSPTFQGAEPRSGRRPAAANRRN